MKHSRIKELAEALLEMTDGVSAAESSKAVSDFARYLARGRMLKYGEKILSEYQELYNAKHGIVAATVTLLNRVPDAHLNELRSMLQKKYAATTVEITQKVDARILGGMKVQVDDEVFDGTVQHSLNQLQASLLTN